MPNLAALAEAAPETRDGPFVRRCAVGGRSLGHLREDARPAVVRTAPVEFGRFSSSSGRWFRPARVREGLAVVVQNPHQNNCCSAKALKINGGPRILYRNLLLFESQKAQKTIPF